MDVHGMRKLHSVVPAVIFAFAGMAVAKPISAFRVEFIVQLGENRAQGAEVCFFRAAGMGTSAFERYLSTDDVRCLPADKIIAISPGFWNYFARHPDGYVSNHPGVIKNPEPTRSERGYRRVPIRLQPAALLDFADILTSLLPGEHFVAYYPNPGERGSSVQPLIRGHSSMLVPAGITIVPMAVKQGYVTRILDPLVTSAGRIYEARLRTLRNGSFDLVAWVQLDRSMLSDHEILNRLEPFSLRAIGLDGRASEPFPTATGSAAHMSFQIFLDAPARAEKLALHGRMWEDFELPIPNLSEKLINLTEPVIAAPAGVILVRWSRQTTGSVINDLTVGPPDASVTLLRLLACRVVATASDDQDKACQVVRKLTQQTSLGEAEIAGVPVGTYELSVGRGSEPETRKRVYVHAGQTTVVEVEEAPIKGSAVRF